MGHKWLGPYEVVKNLSKGFFTLQNMESGHSNHTANTWSTS